MTAKLWSNCIMDVFFKDDPMESYPCQVRVGDTDLTVLYDDGDKEVSYYGNTIGGGHFRLASEDTKGRGTLHRIGEDDVLEGWWTEEGTYGMWRIQLDDEE